MGRALISGWRSAQRPLFVSGALVCLALAVVPPIANVLLGLVQASDGIRLLRSVHLWRLLLDSLLLSTAVTAACVVLGVPLGVVFARAWLPLRGLIFAAHLCIAFLPPFVPALGWFHIFGTGGVLGHPLLSDALFSEVGAIGVMTSCFTPIVSALTALGVSGIDRSLEEAGIISLGRFRTAMLVLIPCAAPAISLAALVVFALAFSELGVPLFLGVNVYPTVVFSRVGGMDFAPGEAAVLMLPLLLVALLLAALERRFAGRRALAAIGSFRRVERALFPRRAALVIMPLCAAMASIAPIAALLVAANLRGNLAELLVWIGNSPFVSAISTFTAAAIMTLLAVILGCELARRSRAGALSDVLSTIAFSMPSSVLGIGIMAAWNRSATAWLYTSIAILVVGFVARYCALAVRTYAAVLTAVPTSLDESARVAGASYWARLSLTSGLTWRGVAGTFLLALLFGLRDLETAVLYYPAGAQPLTVRIFTLEANGPPGIVAALSVLQVTMTFSAVILGARILRRMGH